MPIDVEFAGGINALVYYRIIHNLIVPEGANLAGHKNGMIIYISDRPSDQNTMATIINAIDDANEASREYLMAMVRFDLRRMEYIPDIISLIRKEGQNVESNIWQAVPVNVNDPSLIYSLFEANRPSMTEAVEGLVRDMNLTVDLFDIDFRQGDD